MNNILRSDVLVEAVSNGDNHDPPIPHPVPSDTFMHCWFQGVSMAQKGVVQGNQMMDFGTGNGQCVVGVGFLLICCLTIHLIVTIR